MKCGLESSGLADDFSPLQHTRALTGANTHTHGAGVGTSQTPRTRGGPWPANQPLPAPTTFSATVLPDNVLPNGLADDFSPLQHTRALTGANTHTHGAGVGTSQTPRTRGGLWPAKQPLPAPSTFSAAVLPDNVLSCSHSNSPL